MDISGSSFPFPCDLSESLEGPTLGGEAVYFGE